LYVRPDVVAAGAAPKELPVLLANCESLGDWSYVIGVTGVELDDEDALDGVHELPVAALLCVGAGGVTSAMDADGCVSAFLFLLQPATSGTTTSDAIKISFFTTVSFRGKTASDHRGPNMKLLPSLIGRLRETA
jgi:hypothetical protein